MKILIATVISLSLLSPESLYAQEDGAGQRIVVMDSGLATGDSFAGRVLAQWCWSRPSKLSSVSANPESVHYDIFSMCRNGNASDFSSANAAEIPISTFHNIAPYYTNHLFGTNHGSLVLGEAATTARNASFIVINNTFYDSSRSALNINGVPSTCGIHGPNQTPMNIPGLQQPSGSIGCYSPSDAERQAEVISKILTTSNIAAINYSAFAIASCTLNDSIFRTLKDRNIAFVAAAGNEGPNGPIRYPACNSNVISVGAVTTDLAGVHPVTSLNGPKLDFLADGIAPNVLNTATSFAAPIVAGAFAIVQSAESRVRTIDEIKFALNFTSPQCVPTPKGCVNVVTRESALEAAECLRFGSCRPNLPPGGDDGGVGVVDNGNYGPIFGDNESTSYEVNIDFSALSGTGVVAALTDDAIVAQTVSQDSETINLPPTNRDVVVSFTGTMGTGLATNGIEMFVNGDRLESTGIYASERDFTYVINRHYFDEGENIVSLRPILDSPSRLWGLSNISVELNPIVELTIGETDTARYGYSETPERPTGLRMSFPLTLVTTDMMLSVTGWDIDTENEIEVFLNGISQGFLTVGEFNSTYSEPDSFLLEQTDLGLGNNLIEFVSRTPFGSGSSLERWALRDVLVDVASAAPPPPADIVAESASLEEETLLKRNVPFTIRALVRNDGDSPSPSTTLRFYLSDDDSITTNDLELEARAFGALSEQRMRFLLQQIQTSQINTGHYIGFCVDPVPGEVILENNCSNSVLLEGPISVSPILMLLLDKDE